MVCAQHLHNGAWSSALTEMMEVERQRGACGGGALGILEFTAFLTWVRASSFRGFCTLQPSASVMSKTAEEHYNRNAQAKDEKPNADTSAVHASDEIPTEGRGASKRIE